MDIVENVRNKRASKNTQFHFLYTFYMMGYTKQECSQIYGKSITTLNVWIRKYQKNGFMNEKERKRTFRKFDEVKRRWIVDLYMDNPILYLDEAAAKFKEHFGINISMSSISRILHVEGLSWKVIERRAIQVRLDQVSFFQREMNFSWDLHQLLFIDEVSIDNRGVLRNRGYGVVGEKIVYRGEFTRKARVSLLCCLGQTGMVESYITEGTFDRQKFFHFMKILALSGKVKQYPGKHSVWIMDGARIHLDQHIVDYLRSLNIIVVFLPPYTPYFNPIEYVFGYLKKQLQRIHLENVKSILPEVSKALQTFAKRDYTRVFNKCGYFAGGHFDPAVGLAQDLRKFGFKRA